MIIICRGSEAVQRGAGRMLFHKKDPEADFLRRAARYPANETEAYAAFLDELARSADAARQDPLGLRVLAIADTHKDLAFHDTLSPFLEGIGAYDICLLLGDVTQYDLDVILRCVPREKIAAVLGNHDEPDLLWANRLTDLHGKVREIAGVRIAGIEGSFRYKEGAYPMMTQYESLELARKMPQEADLLVTHDAAFNPSRGIHLAHRGLAGISYYLLRSRVGVHIHGHLHSEYRRQYPNGAQEISVYPFAYLEI